MKYLVYAFFITSTVFAGPILQMNKAFNTLNELMPFLMDEQKFKEVKNDKIIRKHLSEFQTEFRLAGHDQILKSDLFNPSYQLIMERIQESRSSFENGKKDYSYWMMRDSLSSCLECHTRLPVEHTSSFQDGALQIESGKYKNPYELGMTYLIVRRYTDAKEQFLRVIQDKLIKKEETGFIKPFQQVLLIELKVMKNPQSMIAFIRQFETKKIAPSELREILEWKKRLEILQNEKSKTGLKSEKEAEEFINRRLVPIENELQDDKYKPDLLLASGVLSVYFFENPQSKSAPVFNYWLGKIESELRKDDFLSSADLFLKQCIKKYPLHPIAKKCFSALKENTEFMYSGSGGIDIPKEVSLELNELKTLIDGKK